MANFSIKTLLLFALLMGVLSCLKDFSSDLDDLDAKEKLWLEDGDNNGLADSLEIYAPGCVNNLDSCYRVARDSFFTPLFSLEEGDLPEGSYLILSSHDPDVQIRYSLNDDVPLVSSTLFDDSILISDTLTITVALFLEEKQMGPVIRKTYNVLFLEQVESVTFSPSAKDTLFRSSVTVHLSTTTPGANIFFTTDSSPPTDSSILYKDSILLTKSTFLRTVAYLDNFHPSKITEQYYEVVPLDTLAPPTADPPGGFYTTLIFVELKHQDSEAEIRYTLDGSEPNSNSKVFENPISIPLSLTLKAKAFKTGFISSTADSFVYVIEVPNPTFPPEARNVQITGVPAQGETLIGRYVYFDADSSIESGSTYQWLRNGEIIPNAVDTLYTIQYADSGKALTFEVTPRSEITEGDSNNIGIAVTSSPTSAVTGYTPPEARNVFISGNLREGEVLTGSYSFFDAEGDADSGTSYRWLRDGDTIPDAVNLTYNIQYADSGKTLSFEVTPRSEGNVNTVGSPARTNTASTINGFRVPTANTLSIAGELKQGITLVGHYVFQDEDGDTEQGSTYRWLRNGTPIAGATDTLYAIQYADSGTILSFEVTPHSADTVNYIGIPVAVNASGPVMGFHRPTASNLSIEGELKQGITLKGTYTFADEDGDTEQGSTYRWLRDDIPIVGATDTLYAIQYADSGTILSFEVTPHSTGQETNVGLPISVAASSAVTGFQPPSVSNVSISGSRLEGEVLTGSYTFADSDGDSESTSTFQWFRNGDLIDGATSLTYTILSIDMEKTLTFQVTPVSEGTVNTIGAPGAAFTFVGFKMALISAANQSFMMGNDTGDTDEQPAHSVSFSRDFYMDTTEVTQGIYDSLMSVTYTGYTTPDWSTFGQGSTLPVYNVNWFDAVLFCNARSKRDGYDTVYSYTSISGTPGNNSTLTGLQIDMSKNGYHLPTEAQWEFAGRAGSSTFYFWGEPFNDDYAWSISNSSGISPVAQKLPNYFGLYDVIGNVSEWVQDAYDSSYYASSPAIDPLGPSTDSLRVMRGGARTLSPSLLGIAARSFNTPDYRFFTIGFRCSRL